MGAYILLYPGARVLTLVFIFPLPVPAVVFLGLWYVMQFLAGIDALGRGRFRRSRLVGAHRGFPVRDAADGAGWAPTLAENARTAQFKYYFSSLFEIETGTTSQKAAARLAHSE